MTTAYSDIHVEYRVATAGGFADFTLTFPLHGAYPTVAEYDSAVTAFLNDIEPHLNIEHADRYFSAQGEDGNPFWEPTP